MSPQRSSSEHVTLPAGRPCTGSRLPHPVLCSTTLELARPKPPSSDCEVVIFASVSYKSSLTTRIVASVHWFQDTQRKGNGCYISRWFLSFCSLVLVLLSAHRLLADLLAASHSRLESLQRSSVSFGLSVTQDLLLSAHVHKHSTGSRMEWGEVCLCGHG